MVKPHQRLDAPMSGQLTLRFAVAIE